MNPKTRYTILLAAGIANICISMYAFALVITQSVLGLESLWVILLGFFANLAGIFLIARMLPPLLLIRQGEPTPILFDERTNQILHRAGITAFTFFIVTLIMAISVFMALPQFGYSVTENVFITVILIIWITGILIFTLSMTYHSRK